MKKRLISAALGITTFIMSLPQLVIPASAASTPAIAQIRSTALNLYDDSSKTGDESISYTALDGSAKSALKSSEITDTAEGWSWSGSTKTLTLNGAMICHTDTAVVLPDGATVRLNGANTVRSTTASANNSLAVCAKGALTITGDGSLYAGTAQPTTLAAAIYADGVVTIGDGSSDPHIVAYSDSASAAQSYGISCGGLVMRSGVLSATGGVASATGAGVYSKGNVTISGGRFNAEGNYAPSSYGVYALGTFAANGGTSIVMGGDSTNESAGVFAANVSNAGGTLMSIGGKGSVSCGINAKTAISLTNGLTIARADGSSTVKAMGVTPTGGTASLIGGSDSGYIAVYGDSSVYKVCTSSLNFRSGSFGSLSLEKDGYTFSNSTLTMKNLIVLSGSATAITLPTNATVNFSGVNFIQSSKGSKTYGILSETNVTYNGSGTLISAAGASTGESYGLFNTATLTCSGGELIGIGGSTTANSTGIGGGGRAVLNGGDITATTASAGMSRSLYAPVMTIGSNGSGPDVLALSGNCTGSASGIYVNNGGTLTISGGTVAAVSMPFYGGAGTQNYAIYAERGFTSENADIIAASGSGANSMAVNSSGAFSAAGGNVLLAAGAGSAMSEGVYASKITLNNSKAQFSSGNSDRMAAGIYSSADIGITGGSVKSYSSGQGKTANGAYGAMAYAAVSLQNASADLYAPTNVNAFGIRAITSLTLSNSVMRAAGKNAGYAPTITLNDTEVVSPAGGSVTSGYIYAKNTIATDALVAPAADLTYNLNYSGAAAATTKTYVKDITVTVDATVPTRSGYKFLGWATSASGAAVYQPKSTLKLSSDVTLYAVWEAETTYTVTYNLNGGSGTAPTDSTKYTANATVTVTSTKPTRSGYTFKGWATSASGAVAYASGATFKITKNMTLYAVWEQITYTVTYNLNGGSGTAPTDSTKYAANATVTVTSTKPTRSGYTFKGWATSASGTVAYASGATFKITKNMTLYAVWEQITYTVTYNLNGGSGTAPTDSTKYTANATVTVTSTKPTRSGYAFKGWATSASGAVAYASGATFKITKNMTLYAVWEQITYTVTYNLNGSSGTAPTDSTKYAANATVTVTSTKPTRSGYTFKGWATSASGAVAYASGATFKITKNMTLYAVWEAETTYTVTYNLNGGSGTAPTDSTKYAANATVTVTSTKPTRSGYTFKGWATSTSGAVAYASGATFKITKNMTLYAVWEQITYTVTYNLNGGSGTAPTDSTKYAANATVTVTGTKPTRSGYTFKGWATSASGAVAYASGATFKITKNMTLYAVWEQITYTVTYNLNGGSGTAPTDSTKYAANATVTVTSTKPTRSGYTFNGWATSASGAVAYASGATFKITKNMTLYAVWEAEETVVTKPTNVKATAGDKQVKLTWTAVSGATKYRIQRLNNSTWGTIATVSTNGYTNTGLTNGTTYSYRVLASADGSTWSSASAVVSATPAATVKVSTPTNVKATAGDKQIKLTWTAVSGATKYRVQRLNDSKWGTIATVSTNSYTNTGLTNGTKYSYRVLASADGSTWSSASAVVSATPAATVKVSTPTNVKATADDKQVKLTWTAVSGATKYRVQRLNDSKWGTIATVSTNSYTNTGLTNGTTYSYRVLASADGSTWSSASAVISATPAATVKVSSPTNVKATAGDKQVKLTWTAVSGATKYRIQRLNNSTWGTIATVSTNSYTNTGLTNGTTYSYRVLASADGSTWSGASDTVTVKIS